MLPHVKNVRVNSVKIETAVVEMYFLKRFSFLEGVQGVHVVTVLYNRPAIQRQSSRDGTNSFARFPLKRTTKSLENYRKTTGNLRQNTARGKHLQSKGTTIHTDTRWHIEQENARTHSVSFAHVWL